MKLTENDISWLENYSEIPDDVLTIDCKHKDWEQLKQQILKNQEMVEHLREYLKVMKDEPEGYIKLSRVYHDLRRMLGDE